MAYWVVVCYLKPRMYVCPQKGRRKMAAQVADQPRRIGPFDSPIDAIAMAAVLRFHSDAYPRVILENTIAYTYPPVTKGWEAFFLTHGARPKSFRRKPLDLYFFQPN